MRWTISWKRNQLNTMRINYNSRFEQHNDDSSSSVSPIIAAADVIIDFFIFDLDFGIFNSLEKKPFFFESRTRKWISNEISEQPMD